MSLLAKPAAARLAALAREYVALVDGAGDAEELLRACARVLPLVYAAGLELPESVPDDRDDEPELASPLKRLAAVLGEHDPYYEVFDPRVEEEPVVGSLADDLADIYLDLARALAAYDAGRREDACWSWSFHLRGHAGDHLVDALRVIHRVLQGPPAPAD